MSAGKQLGGGLALLLCIAAALGASGPAERARVFAQLPNWTGQWEIVGLTPDATGGFAESLDEVVHEMRKWGPPPYKPDAQIEFDKVAAEVRKISKADLAGAAVEGITRTCSFGFPSLMVLSPLMFEILITPEETAMIFSGREMRHIYTDSRPHTAKDDLWPTYWGDSIGHWEGQTLVIDTIAVTNTPGLGGGDSPMLPAIGGTTNADYALIAWFSPEARYVERLRMIDHDHLEDRMTIIDPKLFRTPWTISRQYRRVTRLNRMVHEDCEGEERNPIVDGHYTLTPPPAPSQQ